MSWQFWLFNVASCCWQLLCLASLQYHMSTTAQHLMPCWKSWDLLWREGKPSKCELNCSQDLRANMNCFHLYVCSWPCRVHTWNLGQVYTSDANANTRQLWVNFPTCKLTQEMQNCVSFLALALNLRLNFTRVKRNNASANVRPSCWDAECSNVLAHFTVLAFTLDGWTSLAHASVSLV